jgi:predicted porin
MAEAVIYGRIYAQQVWYDTNQFSGWPTNGRSMDDDQGMGRVGFRFSEDLGGGLKGLGVWEFQMDAPDGTGINEARQQWVALEYEGLGQLAMGGFNSSYKTFGGVNYDPFAATALQARQFGGMSQGTFGHNSFFRNAFQYLSPDIYGLNFQAQYSADQNGGVEGRSNLGSSGDYSLGLKYNGGIFEIIGAYSYQNRWQPCSTCTTIDVDDRNWKVGGKLELGNFGITGQYENVHIPSSGFGTNERVLFFTGVDQPDTGDFWFASLQYKWGNLLLVGQGGQFNANGSDADANYWVAGGRYFFSKRTSLYGGYRKTDADQSFWDNDAWMFGLRHDF